MLRAVHHDNKDLRAELAQARRQAAAMREALLAHRDGRFDMLPMAEAVAKQDALAESAFSSHTGRGYVRCNCNCHEPESGVVKHADCNACKNALEEEQDAYETKLIEVSRRGFLFLADVDRVRRALSAALGTHGDPCPEPQRSTCQALAEFRAALAIIEEAGARPSSANP
jgi:hypothetical protein